MQTLLGALLLVSTLLLSQGLPSSDAALVQAKQAPADNLQPIKTESRFQEKLAEETAIIPFKTIYKDDPETEAGIDKVLEGGVEGKKVQIIKTIYYDGKEYGREIVGTEITPPKDKVILRGTKIIWKELETDDGEIKYWKKVRVWATHYDSHCPGCDEWTATGMKQGKGVIAVDPRVIKLGSKVYVPGYGMAVAGDTGGAIKGNIIDLGFEDAKTAGWSAKFTDIYILD